MKSLSERFLIVFVASTFCNMIENPFKTVFEDWDVRHVGKCSWVSPITWTET